jgi:hypothetical protein
VATANGSASGAEVGEFIPEIASGVARNHERRFLAGRA